MFQIDQEFQYFILITTLLILPKALMRYGIPSGLTAIGLGLFTGISLGWFTNDNTLYILSTLGVTSLFLFAGLEIEFDELKQDSKILFTHIGQNLLLMLLASLVLSLIFDLSAQASVLLALGLLTPSTGFILNSLKGFKLAKEEEYWIRTKAIATEIIALGVLFFALQAESLGKLSVSLGVILTLVFILPLMFRFFLNVIAPFAPDSEVTFMILLALVCGIITSKLGAYYLIGAFIVGVVAAQFQHFMKTEDSEKMLYAVGFFSSLFIPFYFYKAGINMASADITWRGVFIGLSFTTVFIPLRYLFSIATIRVMLKGFWKDRVVIAMSLMPTLIFGLVIASVLHERFEVDSDITTGLLVYTILSSVAPSLFLKKAAPSEYNSGYISSTSTEQHLFDD